MLARAFAVFDSERPRPVHIELPLDVITAPAEHLALRPRTLASRPAPALAPLREAAARLRNAKSHCCCSAAAASRPPPKRVCPGRRAGRADCPDDQRQGPATGRPPAAAGQQPVLRAGTRAGRRGRRGAGHRHRAGRNRLRRGVRRRFRPRWRADPHDIDPQQPMRNYTPSLAIHSDARLAMRVLLAELPGGEASPPSSGAPPPCASVRPKTSPAGRTIASCSPRSSPSGRTPASLATRPRPSTAATTWSISMSRAAGSTPPPATAPRLWPARRHRRQAR